MPLTLSIEIDYSKTVEDDEAKKKVIRYLIKKMVLDSVGKRCGLPHVVWWVIDVTAPCDIFGTVINARFSTGWSYATGLVLDNIRYLDSNKQVEP